MEELADAIEDAQYVNAISSQEDGPKPVIPWEKPSDDELMSWEDRVKSRPSTATPFSLEWVCQQPIGYFLFSQFLKKTCKDYVRINFCEDVLRYRKLQTKQERLDLTVQMARFFLGFEKSPTIVHTEAPITEDSINSNLNGVIPEKRIEVDMDNPTEESLTSPSAVKYIWPLPPRTEIEEYDLARPMNESKPSDRTASGDLVELSFGVSKRKIIDKMVTGESRITHMSRDELDALFAAGTDHPICSESIIGLKGPVLAEILSIVQANAFAVTAPKSSRSPSELSSFQKSDSIYRRSSSDSLSLHFLETRNPSSSRSLLDVAVSNNDTAPTDDSATTNGAVDNRPRAASSSQRKLQQNVVSLPTDFFDKAEYVIMESLKCQYWSSFVKSRYWTKLKHFLWYQDRRVIPEDFFVLRVLGRGGFGLVTGKNEIILPLFCLPPMLAISMMFPVKLVKKEPQGSCML